MLKIENNIYFFVYHDLNFPNSLFNFSVITCKWLDAVDTFSILSTLLAEILLISSILLTIF